jgi:hypothetical protein
LVLVVFTRLSVLAAVSMTLCAQVALAQIVRRPPAAKRINWAGVSVAFTQGYSIADGTTAANWDFGSGIEYAARLEHPLQSGVSVGLQGAFAMMPLTYSSAACGSCDARANVRQLTGILHYGQGYTFHPVYELAAGVVAYSNFQRTGDTQTRLGSASADYDFKFSLGYGLGFGLSPGSAIEFVQELGTVVHQRDGLAGSSSNFPRVYTTRIAGKIAF